MLTEVSYIPYAGSSQEQTEDIITFAKFEEGYLVENECNAEEDETTLASTDESYIDDEYDYIPISMNHL